MASRRPMTTAARNHYKDTHGAQAPLPPTPSDSPANWYYGYAKLSPLPQITLSRLYLYRLGATVASGSATLDRHHPQLLQIRHLCQNNRFFFCNLAFFFQNFTFTAGKKRGINVKF